MANNHLLKNISRYNFLYERNKTQITDKNNDKITYLFDTIGRPITIYEHKNGEEDVLLNQAKILRYNYETEEISRTVTPLPNSENLLEDVTVVQTNGDLRKELSESNLKKASYRNLYATEEMQFGDELNLPLNIEASKYTFDKLTNNTPHAERTLKCDFTEQALQLSRIKRRKLVLSAWVKANSMTLSENADSHFELRADLDYGTSKKVVKAEFDYIQQDWQYCALPVFIEEGLSDDLCGVTLTFDFTNNWGEAEICNFELREADWTEEHYGGKNRLLSSRESNSDFDTTYTYDASERLIKATFKSAFELREFVTTFDYNGNGAPVRSVDYNGIVTENRYNEKGEVISSVTYHKDEPANKLYSETILDEKGNETGALNEFGEKICSYAYDSSTGMPVCETDKDGNKIAYGYDYSNDTLLGITSTVDGKQASNTVSYKNGRVSKYSHGGAEIEFVYDDFMHTVTIKVGGQNYALKDNDPTKLTQSVAYANGARYLIESDKRGNVTSVDYNGTRAAEYEYDRYDRPVKLADKENSAYEYTAYNGHNVSRKLYQGYGKEYVTANTYDDLGMLTESSIEIEGETARKTKYRYDSTVPDKKLTSIMLADGMSQYVRLDKLGRVSSIDRNRISKSYAYKQIGDRTSNLIASERIRFGNSKEERIAYAYDEKGNITAIKEGNEIISKYTYDSLSRLIREDNKNLDKTVLISYDENGNILSKTERPYTLADTANLDNGITVNYSYSQTGWKDRLYGYKGVECGSYDGLGNPRSYRGATLTWSHGRRLDGMSGNGNDVAYKYNASGIRISKTVNGKKTAIYLDGTAVIAQETDGEMTYFNRGADGLASFEKGGNVYCYKRNMLGDVLSVINDSGTEIAKYVYDAWGNHKVLVLEDGAYVEEPTTELGQSYLAIAECNPFRYRGYYYDEESGLYYLNTRYYDPEVGRFINADDISEADPETINGLNLFAYCYNNPIKYFDPNGESIILTILIGAVIGAVFSGASNAIHQVISGQPWNWTEFGFSVFGGFVGGAISAIPIGGIAGAFVFGGIGATVNGLITGSVNSVETFLLTFSIGAFANAAAYGISNQIAGVKAQKIFNLNSKSKSLAVQKLQSHPLNMGSQVLKGSMRNAYKNATLEQIQSLIYNVNSFIRNGIYSSIISSIFTSLNIA